MKGRPEHDEVETALRGVPALERADLDGDAFAPRDCGHSRIWLNCKHIDSSCKELLGSDPGTRSNIEHCSSAVHQKVIDESRGVARPTRIVESCCGTERVRARTVQVEICMWLHTESLRVAQQPVTQSSWGKEDFPASGYDAVVLAPMTMVASANDNHPHSGDPESYGHGPSSLVRINRSRR